ncbi:hypothetical protein VM1G_00214 [Cytospora mali]|uniref:Rhodopsin domain-containing protein n=1 Tax=Cytospora mali TaxID=578113 RepID=A0A194VNP4_CYTMA|nr:hypothetical protein VM1G_00214 [Valsa mali]
MGNPYYDPNYNPYPPSVLIGTAILFIIVPIISVGLRFTSRLMASIYLGIDDWITIPSMLICIGLAVTQIIAATLGGLGAHQELVDGHLAHTQQLYVYEKTSYAYQLIGIIGLWVIKLSVLFLYRRIFSVGTFYLLNTVMICITVVWGLAFTFSVAFQCTPVSTFWETFGIERGNSCISVYPFYLAGAICDLVLDIVILLLPIIPLWTLQMPIRQKIAVGATFFLGSIVVAFGIVRLIVFQYANAFANAEPLKYFSDATWYNAGTFFWHLTENVVALLGCCLPTYRPLFKSLMGNTTKMGEVIPGHARARARSGSKKKRALQPLSTYRLQNDDEWPLSPLGSPGSRFISSTGSANTVFEGQSPQAIPQNRIMVQKEFHANSATI